MLAGVISAFERMEFIQEAVLLDNLLFMHHLGKIDFESCEVLLQTEIDMLAMYMAFGRNLNGRLYDASSIYNAPEPSRFLARALTQDRDRLLQTNPLERSLPLFVSHDALCHADVLFRVFAEIKVVHILRHPAAVIDSWLRLGWGRRWGTDPKSLPICFEKSGHPVPWFAADWKTDYSSMSEVDRVIYSVYSLSLKAKDGYEKCAAPAKSHTLLVNFERVLADPESQVARIAGFLGRQPTDKMVTILARERLPRRLSPETESRLTDQIGSAASREMRGILDRLNAEFNDYWKPLTER